MMGKDRAGNTQLLLVTSSSSIQKTQHQLEGRGVMGSDQHFGGGWMADDQQMIEMDWRSCLICTASTC